MEQASENKSNRTALILFIIISIVILDQITKIIARQHLPGKNSISYLNDFVVITYSENTGAFLSLGSTLPEWMRVLIFSVFTALLLAWVSWSLFKDKNLPKEQVIPLALIVGGGAGNLIDRVFRGSVTDFIIMGIGSLRTGIFNIADVAVTAAAIIMLLTYFKRSPAPAEK